MRKDRDMFGIPEDILKNAKKVEKENSENSKKDTLFTPSEEILKEGKKVNLENQKSELDRMFAPPSGFSEGRKRKKEEKVEVKLIFKGKQAREVLKIKKDKIRYRQFLNFLKQKAFYGFLRKRRKNR